MTLLLGAGCRPALLHFSDVSDVGEMSLAGAIRLSCDAGVYAYRLYASLRELDRLGADVILVETLPDSEAWKGVNDRLKRAAYHGLGWMQRWFENHPADGKNSKTM